MARRRGTQTFLFASTSSDGATWSAAGQGDTLVDAGGLLVADVASPTTSQRATDAGHLFLVNGVFHGDVR